MNNIILFATYWNEIEWIDASLEQILRIDPIEIIICDGNFDPRVPNFSTDGTREKIESFISKHSDRARMISAERVQPWAKGLSFLANAGRKDEAIRLTRLKHALKIQARFNIYRVNQALTFSKMMNMSQSWEPGRWVMSYDADQFYTDELIDFFDITNRQTDFELITADEWTFPHDFRNYTERYEKRKWNNMPHKIRPNMVVHPTRHFMIESIFRSLNYQDNFRSTHGGVYHHYKFRHDVQRLRAGYALGDRRPPDIERFEGLKPFDSALPEVITRKGNA